MTKIDFYILPADSIEQRHVFACRLAEKAYKLDNQIYLHCDDAAQANQLDQLLWTWRTSSFLPHRLADADNSTAADHRSLLIGYSEPAADYHGLLINLSHAVPDFFGRFERVAEIVVQTPTVTAATRANYRFYRHRGYQLENHDLRK